MSFELGSALDLGAPEVLSFLCNEEASRLELFREAPKAMRCVASGGQSTAALAVTAMSFVEQDYAIIQQGASVARVSVTSPLEHDLRLSLAYDLCVEGSEADRGQADLAQLFEQFDFARGSFREFVQERAQADLASADFVVRPWLMLEKTAPARAKPAPRDALLQFFEGNVSGDFADDGVADWLGDWIRREGFEARLLSERAASAFSEPHSPCILDTDDLDGDLSAPLAALAVPEFEAVGLSGAACSIEPVLSLPHRLEYKISSVAHDMTLGGQRISVLTPRLSVRTVRSKLYCYNGHSPSTEASRTNVVNLAARKAVLSGSVLGPALFDLEKGTAAF